MSMLDSFFNKGFQAAKCKTLLKLTIPRIKLLRNKKEIQIKQMRRDIAKLLETGQEATARIRVEHIIREEKLMAAQEIIELFCELVTVRLPLIEAQRECPLDLKEAISSVCFAAPRCADLPELLQAQMLFAGKYGKEFVSAATELMPECGVNRQLIELLSVRAPAPDVKLKMLKEIAEEHELDWDPAASETELLKPHEDLLNGPTQSVSGPKLPLPEEKHGESLCSALEQAPAKKSDSNAAFNPSDSPEVPKASHELDLDPAASETELLKPHEDLLNGPTQSVSGPKLPLPEEKHGESLCSALEQAPTKQSDSDTAFNPSDSPEVPEASLQPCVGTGSALEMLPFPLPSLPEVNKESPKTSETNENQSHHSHMKPVKVLQKKMGPSECEPPNISVGPVEDKQFVPFISPPSLFSESSFERESDPPPSLSRSKSNANADLQDILAAAQTAVEMAELAAAAARSAASLAQVRISEIVKKKNDGAADSTSENLFHADPCQSATMDRPYFDHQNSWGDSGDVSNTQSPHQDQENHPGQQALNLPSYVEPKVETDSTFHQPQRLNSMDNEVIFSYPNLFTSKDSNSESGVRPFADDIRTTHEL